ncbi:TetR/AcrR family transcriptional regulator [Mesobacillus persicus]|uniref:TetR/AcrR family transcriptional regulator n=1 Tax=Mesobacillus persicus TaxID=930146 RepID=UPI00147E1D1E|nr:helix-turn-helix domain-containing protein [Mesobacillus persicus]
MTHNLEDKRKVRGEHSRTKILESAKKLFIEFGFKETTIAMVSKKASIGYGTAYTHFPGGKEEIFLTIIKEVLEEFYQIANGEFTVNSKEESLAVTQRNIENFLKLAIKYQLALKVLHEAIGLSHIINENWQNFIKKFIERISDNVKQAMEKGLTRHKDFDPEVVAGVLFYTGEKYMWKVALKQTDKDYRVIASSLAQMYVNGLYR